MASVRKREWTHNSERKTAWVVNYTDQAGRRRLKTFEKRREADAYRLQVETEIEAGVHVAPGGTIRLAQAAELWLSDCDRRAAMRDRMTKSTAYGYRQVVTTHILPRFGTTLLVDLDPLVIGEWLKEKRATLAKRTVFKVHLLLTSILSHAIKLRKVRRNVMLDFKVRAPGGETKRVKPPSLAQVRQLLAALDARAPGERRLSHLQRRAFVPIALFCGLRRGEATALRWENVRMDLGFIQVRHSINRLDGLKSTKTNAGLRDVPIPPIVLDALLDLHRAYGRPEEGFVFPSTSGAARQAGDLRERLWLPVMRRAGLVDEDGLPLFRLHGLRHACVSLFIAQGLSPLHIKGFIGHSDVRTTLGTYGHLFPEDERVKSTVMKVAELFDATRTRQGQLSS